MKPNQVNNIVFKNVKIVGPNVNINVQPIMMGGTAPVLCSTLSGNNNLFGAHLFPQTPEPPQPPQGPKVPVTDSVFEGSDSEGSEYESDFNNDDDDNDGTGRDDQGHGAGLKMISKWEKDIPAIGDMSDNENTHTNTKSTQTPKKQKKLKKLGVKGGKSNRRVKSGSESKSTCSRGHEHISSSNRNRSTARRNVVDPPAASSTQPPLRRLDAFLDEDSQESPEPESLLSPSSTVSNPSSASGSECDHTETEMTDQEPKSQPWAGKLNLRIPNYVSGFDFVR